MLSAKFIETEHYSKINVRQITNLLMLEHLEKFDGGLIIETGSLRPEFEIDTDGGSTLVWDWVAEQKPDYKVISIDIREESVAHVKEKCKHVTPIKSDSISYLNSLNAEDVKDLRLLYLDSFDWSEQIHMQSAFHHMCELTTLWRILPSGCMIVVDDRHTEELGKHFLVDQFFQRLEVEPAFKSYQIGWIKP
jgi:cephalosporin hydroxylase